MISKVLKYKNASVLESMKYNVKMRGMKRINTFATNVLAVSAVTEPDGVGGGSKFKVTVGGRAGAQKGGIMTHTRVEIWAKELQRRDWKSPFGDKYLLCLCGYENGLAGITLIIYRKHVSGLGHHQTSHHLILTTVLGGWYYPHFMDTETEAQNQ